MGIDAFRIAEFNRIPYQKPFFCHQPQPGERMGQDRINGFPGPVIRYFRGAEPSAHCLLRQFGGILSLVPPISATPNQGGICPDSLAAVADIEIEAEI